MTPETCPNCGADVPANAKSCPGCGADEKTGWAEDAYAGSLGLPEETFDYDDFVQREFAGEKARPRGVHWFWWAIAIGIAAVFIVGVIGLTR